MEVLPEVPAALSPPEQPTQVGGRTILCLNAGSSSLKAARYDSSAGRLDLRHTGMVEEVGRGGGRWSIREASGELVASGEADTDDQRDALELILGRLERSGLGTPDVFAHRVVHGGRELTEHAVVDEQILAQLRAAIRFAPLHLPAELSVIEAIAERFPSAPQVVALDTAFHRTMPDVARVLPLPRAQRDEGVVRYGFHGLSYEYLVDHLGADVLGRAVLAHLGSGASMAAIAGGASVDTTMGFTPAGGIVMATRPGDLDPGTLVHLLREHRLDADALERLINVESGLAGLGGAADIRTLLEREGTDADAALAVEVFCRQARKAIGSLATVVNGLDTLVFTAGIGEHEPVIRERICRGLEHLGIDVDAAANADNASIISKDGGAVVVRVEPTDENLMLARHAVRLLAPA